MKLKYCANVEELKFVIFPSGTPHDRTYADVPWTSAGFVKINIKDGELVANCYGRSESLNLDSRPEDSILITKALQKQYDE